MLKVWTWKPALFRRQAIDPETAAFNAQLERTLAELPWPSVAGVPGDCL